LYVHLRVSPHPLFKRQGHDIVCEIPINFVQAALGDVIEVPTIDGDTAKLRIPSGTQPGAVFKLKDKGVPYANSGGRGDQQVKVRVEVPKHLTDEQRALLLQLAKSFGLSVNPQNGKGFFDKVRDVFGAD